MVSETYEEIVFSEPTEAFHKMVIPLAPKHAPQSPLIPHFPKHSDAEEFAKISRAREKIANLVSSIKQKNAEGQPAAAGVKVEAA